jgi:transcription antitermination protein NusB
MSHDHSGNDASGDDTAPPAAPAAPAAPKPRPAAGAARKARPTTKSPRRRSRELALQGLYQWLLTGDDAGVIDAHTREQEGFDKADRGHYDALLHGCITEASALDAVLARHVDRRTSLLSPIEHGVLLIGAFELRHCLEVPYRVAINEAVELAKTFGGTDGHKYVNGVLDKAAIDLRPEEVQAARAR